MQDARIVFLAFLVAHLVGDFGFQTRAMVEGKRGGELGAYLRHGLVHFAAAYLAILFFAPVELSRPTLHGAVLAVVVLHLLCDWLKEGPLAQTSLPPWLTFLADQALHVLALGLVMAVTSADFRQWLARGYGDFMLHREPALWLLVIYLSVVFGGGYLIRVVLSGQTPYPAEEVKQPDQERREKEQRLGMYIGWLERVLVLSAIVAKSPTAVGLIVAAKSIVRFKKVEKSDEFAEYFLLGTFLSILLALAGGLGVRWLLWGTLDLE